MALITIKIERRQGRPRTTRQRRLRCAGLASLAGIGAFAGIMLTDGSASASGVTQIAPHTLQTNTLVAAGKTVSPVVLGGLTTVPTDATRVVFAVSVAKEQHDGTLSAYPAGNAAGGSGDPLAFEANTPVSGTFTEPAGLSDKVTFANASSGWIELSVKITGYTSDVNASDITGAGGTAGQVLTNTGAGASWQPSGRAYTQTTGPTLTQLSSDLQTMASVVVPSGSYLVTFTGTLSGVAASPDGVACGLFAPSGAVAASFEGNAWQSNNSSVLAGQALISTSSGGTIAAKCGDHDGSAEMVSPSLIATAEGAVSGFVTH